MCRCGSPFIGRLSRQEKSKFRCVFVPGGTTMRMEIFARCTERVGNHHQGSSAVRMGCASIMIKLNQDRHTILIL